jgi:hypothetical protein
MFQLTERFGALPIPSLSLDRIAFAMSSATSDEIWIGLMTFAGRSARASCRM